MQSSNKGGLREKVKISFPAVSLPYIIFVCLTAEISINLPLRSQAKWCAIGKLLMSPGNKIKLNTSFQHPAFRNVVPCLSITPTYSLHTDQKNSCLMRAMGFLPPSQLPSFLHWGRKKGGRMICKMGSNFKTKTVLLNLNRCFSSLED